MGNQLLMKSTGIALFSAVMLHAEITVKDIDNLVNDIKQERIGLTKKEIESAKDPFIYPNGKYTKVFYENRPGKGNYRFVLTAIVNDRVKINRKWYSLNSKINGFTISGVGKNYVRLTRKNEHMRIFLKQRKNKK